MNTRVVALVLVFALLAAGLATVFSVLLGS